tara:strand:+ start:1906 stop:2337 length:432 start_codon:yes stop_codon:yes gene_type:complete
MAQIRKVDSKGLGLSEPLLPGEFGIDLSHTGDDGRVSVGLGTENIPLATLNDLGAVNTVATVGQVDIKTVSSTNIILKLNGVIRSVGTHYTVTDLTTIKLLTALVGGEVISVIDTSDIETALDNLQIIQKSEEVAQAYAIALG